MESNLPNVDRATVDDFGREWQRFDQSGASSAEVQRMFGEYFAVFPWDSLPRNPVGFDAGCGSGRWAALVDDVRVEPRCHHRHPHGYR